MEHLDIERSVRFQESSGRQAEVPPSSLLMQSAPQIADPSILPERPPRAGQMRHLFGHYAEGAKQDTDASPLPPSVTGRSGAQGREGFVQTQAQRAYAAGLHAPQVDFGGTLHRNVDARHWEGYANHLYGDARGGRYNDPGQRLIYASPSADEALNEMAAYSRKGQDPMAKKAHVEFDYQAHADPATGRGGMADVSSNMSELGLLPSALTEHKGGTVQPADRSWVDQRLGRFGRSDHRSWLSHFTGEDPYLHSRALGRGAREAGASSLRVPSATGGNQIDIIPVNTDPTQLQYERHDIYDASGTPTAHADAEHLNQHGPTGSGKGVMPHGDAPIPDANQLSPNNAKHFSPEESPGRTQRAGAVRYAALGSGLTSALHNINAVRHGEMGIGEAVGNTALNTGVGAASGWANDALSHRLGGGRSGGLKGGALVDAVTSGLFSTWDNAKAYGAGKESAGQATANVLVDTGVGVGSGLAGAAAGAALGSVIPVAGTAAGALVGFGAGMLGSWAAHKLADGSGFTDWAKRGLGGVLNHANKPLAKAWDGIAGTTDAISAGVGSAGRALNGMGHSAWSGAKDLTSSALGDVSSAGKALAGTGRKAWRGLTGWL